MDQVMAILGWLGLFAPTALGAIGSILGVTIAGQAACGAILETDSGYGKYIGISALPSSQVIYGLVVMMAFNGSLPPETSIAVFAPGLFGIGVLLGLALLLSAYYQGQCLATAIRVSKSKPEVFGLTVAPAAIVEGFAVFAFIFALVLSNRLFEV